MMNIASTHILMTLSNSRHISLWPYFPIHLTPGLTNQVRCNDAWLSCHVLCFIGRIFICGGPCVSKSCWWLKSCWKSWIFNGCFQKLWVFPQNGRFIVENPIKMDDLGVFPYFWKHPYSLLGTVPYPRSQPAFGIESMSFVGWNPCCRRDMDLFPGGYVAFCLKTALSLSLYIYIRPIFVAKQYWEYGCYWNNNHLCVFGVSEYVLCFLIMSIWFLAVTTPVKGLQIWIL